eukprot:scaffold40909_cov73-Phaeocystis_antarctica.AAC.8
MSGKQQLHATVLALIAGEVQRRVACGVWPVDGIIAQLRTQYLDQRRHIINRKTQRNNCLGLSELGPRGAPRGRLLRGGRDEVAHSMQSVRCCCFRPGERDRVVVAQRHTPSA